MAKFFQDFAEMNGRICVLKELNIYDAESLQAIATPITGKFNFYIDIDGRTPVATNDSTVRFGLSRIISVVYHWFSGTATTISSRKEFPAQIIYDPEGSPKIKAFYSKIENNNVNTTLISATNIGSWPTGQYITNVAWLTIYYGSYLNTLEQFELAETTIHNKSTTPPPSSGGCCFARDTLITMADGTKKLAQNIIKGDSLLSYDINTQQLSPTYVKAVVSRTDAVERATLLFSDGSLVTMSAYHPLYTQNGWRSLTSYNNYDLLVVGDNVKTTTGWKTLINVETQYVNKFERYNFDVEHLPEDADDIDNFFANDTLAHNGGSGGITLCY